METDSSTASLISQASQSYAVSATDISAWWKGLSEVLRQCYTPNRADLEIPDENSEHFQEWAFSSAAQVMSNSDTQCREKVVAFVCGASFGIRIMMNNMEQLSSSTTHKGESVSKLLRESVNPKNGRNRTLAMRQAVDADYLTFSIKVLKDLMYSRSQTKSHSVFERLDSTITNILWFQSAAAANDSGFALKVREMLKVKFFHHDLFKKMFFGKSAAAHYPLLKILRQLSKNSKVSKTLGKEGVMSTIRKVFSALNNQPSGKLLILMDALSQLTKDKINCIRFLKAGMLVQLVRCFAHWISWKGRGLLRLSKSIINIYSHIAQTKSGRKALVQCDAVSNVRKFCDQCPSEKSFDDVIMRAAAMISVCYDKDKLPLENVESPIHFEIPSGSFSKNDSGSSSDDEGSESDEEAELCSDEIVEDDDDDESTDNDDEKLISDDEELDYSKTPLKKNNKSQCPTEDSTLRLNNDKLRDSKVVTPITLEKLEQYCTFFEELGNTRTTSRQKKRSIMKLVSRQPSLDENFNETSTKSKSSMVRSDHKYLWLDENPECRYWDSIDDLRREYVQVSNEVRHVSPFVKIAYPDLALGYSTRVSENMLTPADRSVLRNKLLSYITRTAGCDTYKPKVVYCLDDLIPKKDKKADINLGNSDEKYVGRYDRKTGLQFESRFESGNLRKVIQVGEREYDLLITSDINSRKHNQWFYFEIANVCDDIPYTFNLINCTKTNSLFNYGMQPVVFSVTDAVKGRPGWCRSGSNICYYKNGYKCVSKKSNRVYHTLSFTLNFCHKGDIVYVAYHIPYTYTRLLVDLSAMMKAVENKSDILVRYDALCFSVNKNEVPLLTITMPEQSEYPIKKRKIIFLTSRVHPGESNASWMMKGILEFLMFGKTKNDLLKNFVFKIVPMLNVEGVINGCHRCGLTSEDLNRCWKFPVETQHPTIFHTKMLIEYCKRILNKTPVLYCDLHGHSRRKNVFFYGCSFTKSWNIQDKSETEDPQTIRSLPENMDRLSSAFCLSYCNYDVRKSRETTARVAVWRDYEILRSYTLECSYSGCDRGPFKGTAFGTNHLLEIGKHLCESFSAL